MRGLILAALAGLACAATACGDDAGGSPSEASANEPPPGESSHEGGVQECCTDAVHVRLDDLNQGFFAQPWPLSTRLRADGSLDLEGMPTPADADFVNENLDLVARETLGFGTNSAIFLGLDGALDPTTLPSDAAASLEPHASVTLVDIDPQSADYGTRCPILCSYREQATAYNPPHLLACLPLPGFPLRPATLYGLFVHDRLLDADGRSLQTAPSFAAVFDGDDTAVEPALVEAFAPFVEFARSQDDGLETLVGGTVFRTSDPTERLRALARDVESVAVRHPESLTEYPGELPSEEAKSYRALEGRYVAPIYQQGETPYLEGGGNIEFDDSGNPILAKEAPLRFGLSVPSGPTPENGWPVVLYQHATAEDALTIFDNGLAGELAQVGIAVASVDAPVHGTRRPSGLDPSLLFFNINNPPAIRDNMRQSAVDLLYFRHVIAELALDSEQSPTQRALHFDPERVFVLGHSQGGLTAALMLAVAPDIRGAMLSGAGGSVTMAILFRTEPVNMPVLARTLLALPLDEPLDAFHPVLAVVQAFTEVVDPANYAPYFYRWPGGHGFDLWLTQGMVDREVPPEVTAVLAGAAGTQPVAPLLRQLDVFRVRELEPISAPVRANVEAYDGERYTAVYTQYPEDGHRLIFDNPDARARLRHWFETLAEDGRAELIVP